MITSTNVEFSELRSLSVVEVTDFSSKSMNFKNSKLRVFFQKIQFFLSILLDNVMFVHYCVFNEEFTWWKRYLRIDSLN